jgi:hypothetical protein
MTKLNVETSPQLYARIGGVLYLIMIILGIVQEVVVRGNVVVSGNAAATAANLRSMESLWRFGIAGELFLAVITIILGLILYLLTKPVSKDLALLALLFNIVATTVATVYTLQLAEALFPVGNSSYLGAFTSEQLSAMSSLSVKAHAIGYGFSLLLFGPFFLVTGYLIIKSGYFPKTLGILYMIPGLSYMTSSFALILAPTFASRYYFFMAGPAFFGELSLCLWLILKGVNVQKWEDVLLERPA